MEKQVGNSVTSTTAMQFKTEWKYKVEFALTELQFILFFNPNELTNNYTNNFYKEKSSQDNDKPLSEKKHLSFEVIRGYINFIQKNVNEKKKKELNRMELLNGKTLELLNYFEDEANKRVNIYQNYLSNEKEFLNDLKLNNSVSSDKFLNLKTKQILLYLMMLEELAEPFYLSYDEELTKRNAGPNIIKNNFMNTKIKKNELFSKKMMKKKTLLMHQRH
jgi:hypothetical protein